MNDSQQAAAKRALEVLSELLGATTNERPQSGALRGPFSGAAESALASRARRREILGADLAGQNCWDILLSLYLALAEGRQSSVMDISAASGIPGATTIRWLNLIAEHGMIQRGEDPYDGRRILVRLSTLGISKIEQCLSADKVSKPSRSESDSEDCGK